MADIIECISNSPLETQIFAQRIADSLLPNDIVTLSGNLGAGKTFMCQTIAAGLGVDEPVTSPSFSIIQEYRGSIPVFHFDFYRLHDVREVVELGFEDYLERGGICLIEWPQVAISLLPKHTISIFIDFIFEYQQIQDEKRLIKVSNIHHFNRTGMTCDNPRH